MTVRPFSSEKMEIFPAGGRNISHILRYALLDVVHSNYLSKNTINHRVLEVMVVMVMVNTIQFATLASRMGSIFRMNFHGVSSSIHYFVPTSWYKFHG